MALTLALVRDSHAGSQRIRTFNVTFDSSYASGGEALTANDFGLRAVDNVLGGIARKSDGSACVEVAYDYANEKLQAFWQTDPGAVGGAAIPQPQVASTTNLSTYSVRLTAIGQL